MSVAKILVVLALLWSRGVLARELNVGLLYNESQCKALVSGVDQLASYTSAITRNGGAKVALCLDNEDKNLESHVATLAALIIPGGLDVAPRFYSEEPQPQLEIVDEKFDEFEFKVFRLARERKIPIFGICRGLQLINVALGGSLYQDIPTHLKAKKVVKHRLAPNEKGEAITHLLKLVKDTALAKSLDTLNLETNSYHHQGIKMLAPGLKAIATSDDGLIEAFESQSLPYIFAVQFHPEKVNEENKRASDQMAKVIGYFFSKL